MTSQQLARQLGVGRVCCRPEFDLVGPSSVTYARTTVTIARSSHDAGACSELGHSRMRRGQSRQRQGARRNSSERSSSSGRAAACGPTTGGCHRNRPGTVEKVRELHSQKAHQKRARALCSWTGLGSLPTVLPAACAAAWCSARLFPQEEKWKRRPMSCLSSGRL